MDSIQKVTIWHSDQLEVSQCLSTSANSQFPEIALKYDYSKLASSPVSLKEATEIQTPTSKRTLEQIEKEWRAYQMLYRFNKRNKAFGKMGSPPSSLHIEHEGKIQKISFEPYETLSQGMFSELYPEHDRETKMPERLLKIRQEIPDQIFERLRRLDGMLNTFAKT